MSKNLDKFEFLQATSLARKQNEDGSTLNPRRLADVSDRHSFRRPPYINHSPLSQRGADRDEQLPDYDDQPPLYLPTANHYQMAADASDLPEKKRKGARRAKAAPMASFRYCTSIQLGDPQKGRKKRSIYAKIKEF